MDRIAAISTIDEVIPIVSKDEIVTAQAQDDVVGLKTLEGFASVRPRDVPDLVLQCSEIPDGPIRKRRLFNLIGTGAGCEEVLHGQLIVRPCALENQI